MDLYLHVWVRSRRFWSRRGQSSGRGDVISVADFGLLALGSGGRGVGLLTEQRGGEINGDDGEDDGGNNNGRVQIHDGGLIDTQTKLEFSVCVCVWGGGRCVYQSAVTHTLSSASLLHTDQHRHTHVRSCFKIKGSTGSVCCYLLDVKIRHENGCVWKQMWNVTKYIYQHNKYKTYLNKYNIYFI